MKQIKYMLAALAGAVYASAWWAAGFWGPQSRQDNPLGILWLIPALFTIGLVAMAIGYCVCHWDED